MSRFLNAVGYLAADEFIQLQMKQVFLLRLIELALVSVGDPYEPSIGEPNDYGVAILLASAKHLDDRADRRQSLAYSGFTHQRSPIPSDMVKISYPSGVMAIVCSK